jgi:hypothetical protein
MIPSTGSVVEILYGVVECRNVTSFSHFVVVLMTVHSFSRPTFVDFVLLL